MTTPTEAGEAFQITIEAAEFYESAFVPSFFAQWAPTLCAAAGVRAGHSVLDVACGTGIVARTAADLVAPDGDVIGCDLNEVMLAVARRVRPDIEWRQGDAAALPFPNQSFDVVVCQMALMFFPDRAGCVDEMSRVLRPAGTVAVIVPGRLEGQVAFGPFVEMAGRHAGPEAMSLLSSYFACGDLAELTTLVGSTGLEVTNTANPVGSYRAPSVDAFVPAEVESTPLLERITDEMYQRIRADAHTVLAPFTRPDGSVEAPFGCNLVVAQRR